MPLPQEQIYTTEDIYGLPEGLRAELIDGRIYYMAPPARRHQRIIGELFAVIHDYIKKKGGGCEVDLAPFAVFLEDNDQNYVEPDISVICDPEKLTDKGCQGAPDWIIEVVSPASRRMDYMIKLFKYRSAGVREYWIVDPEKNRITVYDFSANEPGIYTFSDKIKVGIYPDLCIDFKELNLG
ncbi:MAG: Uma2 family endonuclease [Lachnospiraceae bacterium]|nr:Uma2 family endonuclease [Lachnospiraceae bacterium]